MVRVALAWYARRDVMQPLAYRRALEAAAKVALVLGAAGCDAEATAPEPDASPPPSCVIDDAWKDVGFDASADVFVSPPPGVAVDDAGWGCCLAAVYPRVELDGGVAKLDDAGDPDLMACCRVIELGSKDHEDPNATRWLVDLLACCDATGDPVSTCDLWGPPPPPSTRPSRRRRRALRVDLRRTARRLAPAIPAARSARLRDAAVRTWRGRMFHEHVSSAVFVALAAQMRGAGFAESQVRACAGFAREERRHGVLCGAVVEALGADAIHEGAAPPPVPRHGGVSAREAVVMNLLSIGCMSETVAVALIAAEREQMPAGPLRDLLTRIWADEIGHARFGWRVVASELAGMDGAARGRVAAYLPHAFEHLLLHELAHLRPGSPIAGGEALGVCDGGAARRLFLDVVGRVIVPALESAGMPARRAWKQALAQVA